MIPFSTLDYAPVTVGRSAADALRDAVIFAQAAEAAGYLRVWYTEHHGQPRVAASAPPVLIGQVAAATSAIRVGAGGVMLPNHAPLVVAEQFGTLEAFHPGRIDLGVGRAPAGNPWLRRASSGAGQFLLDVRDLCDLLSETDMPAGIRATPGHGSRVPVHLLGSSDNGARAAAELGLPLVFAAHFSPDALESAITLYRDRFTPSGQPGRPDAPHLIVTVNVLAAEDPETAEAHHRQMLRFEARKLLDRPDARLPDAEIDAFIDSPRGRSAARMFRVTATGPRDAVRTQLADLAAASAADELMLIHQAPTLQDRLASLRLTSVPTPGGEHQA